MPISIFERLGLMVRKVPVSTVSEALSTLEVAGGDVAVRDLEAHYLAGGNIQACAEAFKMCLVSTADADWRSICAADLAGLDVVSIAQEAVKQRRSMRDLFRDRLKEKLGSMNGQ